MSLSVAEQWVKEPLQHFVRDSRARLALLLHPSGQVIGQYGFDDALEVMSAAALAAAIYASSAHLGQFVDGQPFSELHHGGAARQIYLAEVRTSGASLVLLVVFGTESSLGLVRLYNQELCLALRDVAPVEPKAVHVFDGEFERELRRSLSLLFGGDTPRSSPAINQSA